MRQQLQQLRRRRRTDARSRPTQPACCSGSCGAQALIRQAPTLEAKGLFPRVLDRRRRLLQRQR
jgi:hypothetical protein